MSGAIVALQAIRPSLSAQHGNVSDQEIMKLHCLRNRNAAESFNTDRGKNNQNQNDINSVCEVSKFELGMRRFAVGSTCSADCVSLDQEAGIEMPERYK